MIVYTDGSCLSNPGPGGWCYSYQQDDTVYVIYGGCKTTTNNQMEMMAVIEAIEYIPSKTITIYSDSQYVINGATKWMHTWASKNWNVSKANLDLWKTMYRLLKEKTVDFKWVKGHSGDYMNDLVDKAARSEAERQRSI